MAVCHGRMLEKDVPCDGKLSVSTLSIGHSHLDVVQFQYITDFIRIFSMQLGFP